jgi:hypothetical protein
MFKAMDKTTEFVRSDESASWIGLECGMLLCDQRAMMGNAAEFACFRTSRLAEDHMPRALLPSPTSSTRSTLFPL